MSDFAARLGVASIACHVGFVPEDSTHDADYVAVREMVRTGVRPCGAHGQTFALETGQEAAHVLLGFIRDVDRANLRINFDPANLILYGTGEPITALEVLAPLVVSVHCKDGDWPAPGVEGALGKERALGKGSVGIARFVETLRKVGFRRSLECGAGSRGPGGTPARFGRRRSVGARADRGLDGQPGASAGR